MHKNTKNMTFKSNNSLSVHQKIIMNIMKKEQKIEYHHIIQSTVKNTKMNRKICTKMNKKNHQKTSKKNEQFYNI